MKNEILLEIKNVYGKQLIFPVCTTAILLCGLTRHKTLREDDIKIIEALGYIVKYQHPAAYTAS